MNDSSHASAAAAPLDLPDLRDIVIAQIIEFLEGTDVDEWSPVIEDMASILMDHGYDVYTIEDELQDQGQGLPRRKTTCRHTDDDDDELDAMVGRAESPVKTL